MRMFCPAFAYVFKVFFHQLAQKANIAKRFPIPPRGTCPGPRKPDPR
ncbi:MAG: hypothetical protein ACJARR_001425 [Pseudophaeobacter arcticus]|jgi:hypothetical protein